MTYINYAIWKQFQTYNLQQLLTLMALISKPLQTLVVGPLTWNKQTLIQKCGKLGVENKLQIHNSVYCFLIPNTKAFLFLSPLLAFFASFFSPLLYLRLSIVYCFSRRWWNFILTESPAGNIDCVQVPARTCTEHRWTEPQPASRLIHRDRRQ